MYYLFSRPYEPQSNFCSRISSCNNISCPSSYCTVLKNMSMCNYRDESIYMATHITASRKNHHIQHCPRILLIILLIFEQRTAYIFNKSPSSNTISSLASGEKWQTVLFTEMQVGKATPLSIFLLTFLYMLPVCLHICTKTTGPTNHYT